MQSLILSGIYCSFLHLLFICRSFCFHDVWQIMLLHLMGCSFPSPNFSMCHSSTSSSWVELYLSNMANHGDFSLTRYFNHRSQKHCLTTYQSSSAAAVTPVWKAYNLNWIVNKNCEFTLNPKHQEITLSTCAME